MDTAIDSKQLIFFFCIAKTAFTVLLLTFGQSAGTEIICLLPMQRPAKRGITKQTLIQPSLNNWDSPNNSRDWPKSNVFFTMSVMLLLWSRKNLRFRWPANVFLSRVLTREFETWTSFKVESPLNAFGGISLRSLRSILIVRIDERDWKAPDGNVLILVLIKCSSSRCWPTSIKVSFAISRIGVSWIMSLTSSLLLRGHPLTSMVCWYTQYTIISCW